jgi:hypothetical protein
MHAQALIKNSYCSFKLAHFYLGPKQQLKSNAEMENIMKYSSVILAET